MGRQPAGLGDAAAAGPRRAGLPILLWTAAHSLHELTFLIAIGFCWRFPRSATRCWCCSLSTWPVGAWTLAYFAPTMIALQTAPLPTGPDLSETVAQWQNLNYLRVAISIAVSLASMP